MPKAKLESLLKEIRACRICEDHLPLGPNPIIKAGSSARVLIVGQAPGTRVHNTGIPWNDPSGDRLRLWLDIDKETFYDQNKIAIVPMGFCYPGRGKSGDNPPRPECAQTWHHQVLPLLPNVQITLLVGSYALDYFLGKRKKKTLTETVKNYQEYLPEFIPTVHPSPRNIGWLKNNPWFDAELVPTMRELVNNALI